MDFNIIQGQSNLTGTNTYSGTLSLGVTVLIDRGIYLCLIPNANTVTNPTLALNGIAAQTIFDITGNALKVGDLQTNAMAFLMYDASIPGFRLMCCKEVDTGWIDLLGFSFIPAGSRPQYRVIGRAIQFRGTAVIALDNGAGAIVPYTNEASYVSQALVVPYQGSGATGGVVVNPAGSITFNGGAASLPVQYFPDGIYSKRWAIGFRRILAQEESSNAISYTSTATIYISNTGILSLDCLIDLEVYGPSNPVGMAPLRFINSNVVTGQRSVDLRNVYDSVLTTYTNTLFGNANNAGLVLQPNLVQGPELAHSVTMDAAIPSNLGGFNFCLDGLMAFMMP